MQLSFADRQPLSFDAGFASARRRDLGSGAWLDWVPGWLSGADELFELLLGTASWERHERPMYERVVEVPRRVASRPGSEARLVFAEASRIERTPSRAAASELARANARLDELGRALSLRYARSLASVSLAHYRDGADSVAFHGDKLGELRPDTVVAILSLGARRRFALRPARQDAATPRASLTFSVGGGDLLVMGGTCQETWEHGLPKMAQAGPRIAVMFRERSPAPRPPSSLSGEP